MAAPLLPHSSWGGASDNVSFAADVKKDCFSFSLSRSVVAATVLANVACECLYVYIYFPLSQGGRSVKQHHTEPPCAELIWQAVRACPPACSCLSGLQAYGRLAKMQQYMCLGVKHKEANPAGIPAPVKPVDTKKVTFRVVLVGLFSFPAICRNSIYMSFTYTLLLHLKRQGMGGE